MIEFESVSKTFAGGTHAVQDLSLSIPSDKITVIVGPSGCGKTTTLRMINRMLEPSSGRITWDGKPLRSQRKTTLRRQMGYVIQSGGLFPHRTVVENIGTVPGLLGWSKDKTRSRSLELLANVGLDRRMADRYPGQLSGGQQQRVGVARALAADPLVMLMDEPFSAVDPVVRSELHEFFLGLQREISKTIVLITHDIDEAIKLGDQVAILRVGGRLAQAGPPQQLLDEPADAFVEGFVGRDRGYRSLSFLPATGLTLGEVAVVREATSDGSGTPTLVVDGDARPVGWVDADRPGLVHPIGATFVRESDNLRAALDSALTSPYAIAVAVDAETGRYAGTATADAILDQVRTARSGQEPVTLQAAEAREHQTAEAADAVASAYTQLDEATNGDRPDEPRRDDDGGADGAATDGAAAGGAAVDEGPGDGPGTDPDEGREQTAAVRPEPAAEQELGPGGASAVVLTGDAATGGREHGDDAAGRDEPPADQPRPEGGTHPGEEAPLDEVQTPPGPSEDEQPTTIREPLAEVGPAEERPASSGLYRTPRSLPQDRGERG